MANDNNLKSRLEKIKKDKLNPEKINNSNELINEMIANIGSPDPILRDNLIYSIMSNWIIEGYIDDEAKKYILNKLTSKDHLFYNIGHKDDDSVLKRSFSVLLIPPLIYSHRKKPYLTKSEVRNTFNEVCRYFVLENDLRGYVKDKGWAHSAAHTADALDELALCEELVKNDLEEILRLIKNKISNNSYVFINEEDERMCTAVESIINRKILPDEYINNWIENFYIIYEKTSFPKNHKIKMNLKTFLRSLFFRFLEKDKAISENTFYILKKL